MSRLSLIPALDGLRGIAILTVMLFHFSWAFAETPVVTRFIKLVLWGGWVGVDLFFVLSGYLITRGLVAVSALGVKRRLRNFWIRRSLRIFPIYYIAILVGTAVAIIAHTRAPELAYWVYGQNYALAFDEDPERWTSHLWSLAIEEQFYLIWPVIVLLFTTQKPDENDEEDAATNHVGRLSALARWAIVLLVFGVVLRAGSVFALKWIDEITRAKLAYRALPTRMDPLFLGALIAMMEVMPHSTLTRLWKAHRAKLMVLSTLLILALVGWTRGFNFYDRRVIVLGYGGVALLFAGIVSCAVDDKLPRSITNVLSSRPLRAIGRVSYAMYLIHWPLLSLGIPFFKKVQEWPETGKALGFGIVVTLTGIVVTYFLSELSYRFVEMPFLKLKERFDD